jgi:hypothetical protein
LVPPDFNKYCIRYTQKYSNFRAHHTKWKQGDLTSLSWLKGEVRENLGDFRKSIQILTFLSPLPHVPLPFTKTNVLHYDLKKDAINEFGIKYWTSNLVWVTFQEHGSSFYVNIEEKVWLLVKQIRTWNRATKTSLFDRNWAISLKPRRRSRPLRLVWWALNFNTKYRL